MAMAQRLDAEYVRSLIALGAVLFMNAPGSPSVGESMGIGVCREATCPCTREQLDRGMVDTPQGCSKCNQAALEQAKADFKKWYGIYKEQQEISGRLFAEVDAALEEGRKVLHEYWGGELISKLPAQMKMAYELSKGNREGQLKAMAVAIKEMIKLLKSGAYAGATKVAGLGEMVFKLGLMVEKALIKIEEADKVLAGAQKTADDAYESLQKARTAKERMDQLEKDCQASANAPSTKTKDDEDRWESTAEQEAREAQEILQSWTKVEGGYEDMDGNFHDANLAFQEALAIVQRRQDASAHPWSPIVRVTRTPCPPMTIQQEGSQLTAEQMAKFNAALVRGLDHLASALETYEQVLAELDEIGLRLEHGGSRR